jgi:CheY-like chemotaxis protein
MTGEPILIVDDNAMNLKLERLVLETEHYQVLTAKNAQETMKTLEHYQPRLILMDFGLPDVNGVELVRKLKADSKNRDIIILMVTSYDQKGDEKMAKAAGCDGYIHKPIDTQALAGIVAGYLRGGKRGTDSFRNDSR